MKSLFPHSFFTSRGPSKTRSEKLHFDVHLRLPSHFRPRSASKSPWEVESLAFSPVWQALSRSSGPSPPRPGLSSPLPPSLQWVCNCKWRLYSLVVLTCLLVEFMTWFNLQDESGRPDMIFGFDEKKLVSGEEGSSSNYVVLIVRLQFKSWY